jgi:hypothetical protein
MEQQLLESLIVESIKIYGYDVYYLPRTLVEKDTIYGEDPSSRYDTNYGIEMYIKSVDGFQGDGDFLSKFNLEIRDSVIFTVARKTFMDEVATTEGTESPNEGDLIYLPLNKKIFQIKFVEHESMFYQLGSLPVFDLTCELFEYSGEVLNTGIKNIDDLQQLYSPATSTYAILTQDTNPYSLTDEDGFKLVNESYDVDNFDIMADNDEIEAEADGFIDFSVRDPFSEGNV